jgi:peptidyl-prolyl cis-trans isomerase D
MLELLRRGATSKIAAIIIFVPLIAAFALWGIAPEMRRSGGTAIATVGKTEISPEQFQQGYQTELNALSNQFGRRITPDMARQFGLEQRVLSRLVSTAALDTQAKDLGLTLSEQAVADSIKADPNFAGLDGKFSRDAFNNFLRGNGLSEAAYFAIRRKDEVRDQLIDTLQASATVPQAYIDLVQRNRSETRVVEFVTMDVSRVVKVTEPDDAALKTYYEANKRSFMTPAYRKISLLTLTREAVKSKLVITDDEIKAAYDLTKDSYNTQETRRLQQLAFADKAAADKAYLELVKAKAFVEAAAKLGFKESDIDLGVIKQSDLIDAKIAAAGFALKKDEISKPIEGQFSTVILRAVEITAGTNKTFDDVKALVRDKLANERAGREIQAIHDKVEADRTAGRTLKEAGEKHGLVFQAIEAIDRTGNGVDSKPVAGIPDVAKLMAAAFGGAQGVEAEAVELADGGYGWFDVLGTTAETEKAFDTVKTEAKTRWMEIETTKAITEAAAKFVSRASAGESLDGIAKDAGGKIEKSPAITRTTSPQGLTADAVRQAFALPKGMATSTATADGKSRIILRVADVIAAPPANKEQSDRIRAELSRGLQADSVNAYVGGLQARYGVAINQGVLRQTLGLDRTGQ